MKGGPAAKGERLNCRSTGKLARVRISRTGPARPVSGRRQWPVLCAVVLTLVLASACSESEFRYVSNKSIDTYLKVPADWKEFKHDDLLGAEISAAEGAGQSPSIVDVMLSKQSQWRVAFDSDPRPSVEHTLGFPKEPTVEVNVQALNPQQRENVSLAALRNVGAPYDELKDQAEADMNGGTGFRPLLEEELNYDSGVHGIRLQYLVRPEASSPYYAVDQTTLVDSKTQRLYVLRIRAGEEQFLRNLDLITEIAKSFTVKPKG